VSHAPGVVEILNERMVDVVLWEMPGEKGYYAFIVGNIEPLVLKIITLNI